MRFPSRRLALLTALGGAVALGPGCGADPWEPTIADINWAVAVEVEAPGPDIVAPEPDLPAVEDVVEDVVEVPDIVNVVGAEDVPELPEPFDPGPDPDLWTPPPAVPAVPPPKPERNTS